MKKTKNVASYHGILSKMLFGSWFILPGVHASMLQQLRSRIENGVTSLHVTHTHDDNPDLEGSDDITPDSPGSPEVESGIALIKVRGIIGKRLSLIEMLCGGYDLDVLNEQLTEADEDADIHTVIIWWDTPGGIYTGAPETAALIAAIAKRKTVISFTDTDCCSLGYWLASQAGEFYCTHSSRVGSINGFIAAVDMSGEWEKIGWALELFTGEGGDLKAIGLEGKKWTDAEREYVQARVNKQVNEFKSAVRAGRGTIADDTMRGQSFDGDEAVPANLVDANVRDLQQVVDAALAAHYVGALVS